MVEQPTWLTTTLVAAGVGVAACAGTAIVQRQMQRRGGAAYTGDDLYGTLDAKIRTNPKVRGNVAWRTSFRNWSGLHQAERTAAGRQPWTDRQLQAQWEFAHRNKNRKGPAYKFKKGRKPGKYDDLNLSQLKSMARRKGYQGKMPTSRRGVIGVINLS